jgi:hypothetical protein
MFGCLLMRPVHLTDLQVAARAVMAAPDDLRAATAHRIVQAAEIADRYRKHTGQAHPVLGSGTLETAARSFPMAHQAAALDPIFRRSLMLVLHALARRETDQST